MPQTDIDGVEPRDAAHDAHDVAERGGDESSDIQLRSQREREAARRSANGSASQRSRCARCEGRRRRAAVPSPPSPPPLPRLVGRRGRGRLLRCPTRAGEQPLEAARRLIDAGDFGQAAFDCYDAALRAMPDHRLHYEVAVAAYQIGDSPRLQKQLRAAIRLAPTYSDGHFELANALQTDGRAAETEHHLREAARFAQPGSDVAMIYNNLGNVLVDVGDQRGALAAYESGRRIAPTHGYVLNGLGNLYTDTGRPDEAVRTFRRAVRADPAGAHWWYNGRCCARSAAARRSTPTARCAVARRPQLPAGFGAIAHEQHRIREVISRRAALASRDAARAPSAPLYRDLAAAMREVYLLQEAEVMARRSLSLAPTDKEGMRQLKAVLGENGKYEEAGHVGETEARLDVAQERGGATAAALETRPRSSGGGSGRKEERAAGRAAGGGSRSSAARCTRARRPTAPGSGARAPRSAASAAPRAR